MSVVSDSKFNEILKKRFQYNSPANHVDISYLYNHVYLKKYDDHCGNVKYRLIYMPAVKEGGVEYGEELKNRQERNIYIKACSRGYDGENPFYTDDDINYFVHDVKFDSSLMRAKSKIFDLAYCNPWQYFFTGTLSSEKVGDRSDLPKLHKKFTQFIKDYNKYYNCSVKFLIVPELHSDGINYHFHGFLMGFERVQDFTKFSLSDAPTEKIKSEILKGYEVFSWNQYAKSFGYNTVEPIKNHESVAKYCTKYITKEVMQNSIDVGAHVYYRSRGLRVPELLKDGQVTTAFVNSFSWQSQNDFCKVMDVLPEDVDTIMDFIDHNKNY